MNSEDEAAVERGYDGVRLAVLGKRFESVASRMANTLLRTGRSGVLNMARDFSCCIVTADCELISAAECYPIHVLRGADLMARAMKEFHPELERGDAFLHNSPYHGNSHAADHVILVPVIDDDGVHRFTVLAKAHQADCGNSLPTTYMGAARDVYQEGALIFPAVQVQRDYRDIEDIIRMCRMRIRVPDQWHGDYLAMLGSARIGERAMLEMGREVGWESLAAYTAEMFDYSEHLMIRAIRRMPSGRGVASATHDPVPGTPPEGITVKAEVEVDSEAARITVDLRDNPPAYPCGLNLSQACALSACMVGVFNTVGHRVPPNAGSYRRLEVLLGKGTVCGIPRHPTSTSVATTNLGDRVTCAVQRALAQIGDGIGMADGGAAIPATGAVLSGADPRHDGEPFCNEVILLGGSGPGTCTLWRSMPPATSTTRPPARCGRGAARMRPGRVRTGPTRREGAGLARGRWTASTPKLRAAGGRAHAPPAPELRAPGVRAGAAFPGRFRTSCGAEGARERDRSSFWSGPRRPGRLTGGMSMHEKRWMGPALTGVLLAAFGWSGGALAAESPSNT